MERFIGHVLSSHLALARSNKKMDLFISLNTNKCWLLPAIISPSLRLMMGLYGLLERERKGNPPPRNDLDCSSLMICFRIPMKTDHFAMPKWLHTHSMGRSFVRELPLGKTNDIAQHLNIIAVLLIAGYNIKWNFCNLTVASSLSLSNCWGNLWASDGFILSENGTSCTLCELQPAAYYPPPSISTI